MPVRFLACAAWTIFFAFSLSDGGFAGEMPQLPSLPSAPCLPSVQTFGNPNPPSPMEDATSMMPGLNAWERNSGGRKKGTLLGDSSLVPVNPEYYANLAWPVRGRVSSGFGPRGSGSRVRMHQGIDIPVPNGTPVQASMAGMVAEAREYNGYGKTVILDHGNGIQTLYAHCAELVVKPGDSVELGQVIAYAGSTGRATTSHVHFGVMLAGTFRDPTALLKRKPDQFVRKP